MVTSIFVDPTADGDGDGEALGDGDGLAVAVGVPFARRLPDTVGDGEADALDGDGDGVGEALADAATPTSTTEPRSLWTPVSRTGSMLLLKIRTLIGTAEPGLYSAAYASFASRSAILPSAVFALTPGIDGR
jgi:hypothetical protein